jgi:hypothetical protein
MLIDDFLPEYIADERHAIDVRASLELARRGRSKTSSAVDLLG